MAMLACEVVTPTKHLFAGGASMVVCPSVDGSFGILPGHEMLACRMNSGVVTVYTDEAQKEKVEFATYMGFTEVSEDRVIVLGRMGINVEDIDVEAVTKRRDELQAKMDAMSEDDKTAQNERAQRIRRGTIADDLEWCNVQLEAAAKRK